MAYLVMSDLHAVGSIMNHNSVEVQYARAHAAMQQRCSVHRLLWPPRGLIGGDKGVFNVVHAQLRQQRQLQMGEEQAKKDQHGPG